jgi:UDP-N-acetylmuramate--alanine ligase
LLAALFNRAARPIAVAGTSGKSTVTGMIGWILTGAGRDPTIMNGAVMKNFVAPAAPFASARVGQGDDFVAEVDESDGSIALYRPAIGVLGNVSLDHKSLDELRVLFGDFLAACGAVAINADDAESMALAHRAQAIVPFGMGAQALIAADPASIVESATGITATVTDRRDGTQHALALQVPGRHNLMNALAALAAADLAGVPLGQAVAALARFAGLARRFDIVGTSARGVTVIDDFGHNPEKVAATLATLRAQRGRVIVLFQPHGYGPLRQMGDELAQVLATRLDGEDRVLLTDPVYFGGTVDRSVGSERIVALVNTAGGHACHTPTRAEAAAAIVAMARPGDRVVVMGARDDTLAQFAADLLARV